MHPRRLFDLQLRLRTIGKQFVRTFVQVAAGRATRKVGNRRRSTVQTLKILQVIVVVNCKRKGVPS